MFCGLPMAAAQQADPSTGTVTGQVIFGDSQLPARFAGVMLLGVPSGSTLTSQSNANTGQAKPATDVFGSEERVQVVTGLDGSYTATHVVPGEYYAFPEMAGYVEPAAMLQAAMDAGTDMTKQIPGIPIVHVAAGASAQQNLTLTRGGAVSGHVLWDDGSPIPHAVVAVQPAKEDGKKLPSQFGALNWASAVMGGGAFSITDDLGQYRIAGLAPGKYVAVAVVMAVGQFATHSGKTTMTRSDVGLTAYAPESFRKSGAKPIAVSAGQEQGGEDITLSLTGIHSVSGRVVSAEDEHGMSSGMVQLKDMSDPDLKRSAHVDSNGNFTVQAVPSGTYQLTVTGAADAGRNYADGDQSVVITDSDVVGVSIALQSSKNAKGNASP
jgi:protocatechuate 3,4-dioxygenase beta subunit